MVASFGDQSERRILLWVTIVERLSLNHNLQALWPYLNITWQSVNLAPTFVEDVNSGWVWRPSMNFAMIGKWIVGARADGYKADVNRHNRPPAAQSNGGPIGDNLFHGIPNGATYSYTIDWSTGISSNNDSYPWSWKSNDDLINDIGNGIIDDVSFTPCDATPANVAVVATWGVDALEEADIDDGANADNGSPETTVGGVMPWAGLALGLPRGAGGYQQTQTDNQQLTKKGRILSYVFVSSWFRGPHWCTLCNNIIAVTIQDAGSKEMRYGIQSICELTKPFGHLQGFYHYHILIIMLNSDTYKFMKDNDE
jgi:hypothetical protein